MTTKSIRPATLAGIKRLAKIIKRERGISHAQALDAAAQAGDFENFKDARNALEPSSDLAAIPSMEPRPAAPPTDQAAAPAALSQAPPRQSLNSTGNGAELN